MDIHTGRFKEAIYNEDTPAVDFFHLMWPDKLWDEMIDATNNNGRASNDPGEWCDVGTQEMKQFFGLMIATAVLPRHDREDHWRSKNNATLTCPAGTFGQVMTKRRFKAIWCNFRTCEYGGNDLTHPLRRVQPTIDALKEGFANAYVPGNAMCVDEACIATKSKRCPIRHYNPRKPNKFHMKLYCLCDAITSYMVDFIVDQRQHMPADVFKVDGIVGLSRSEEIVCKLLEPYLDSSRMVATDNWYTSPRLAVLLRNRSISFVGTCRARRTGLPKPLPTRQKPKPERGHFNTYVDADNGIRTDVWYDSRNKGIILVSSGCGNDQSTVDRQDGANVVKVDCPPCLLKYVKLMGGVDNHDQMRSMYSIVSSMSPQKWWKRLYLRLLDIAITNAYILYRMARNGSTTHKRFMELLVAALTN